MVESEVRGISCCSVSGVSWRPAPAAVQLDLLLSLALDANVPTKGSVQAHGTTIIASLEDLISLVDQRRQKARHVEQLRCSSQADGRRVELVRPHWNFRNWLVVMKCREEVSFTSILVS